MAGVTIVFSEFDRVSSDMRTYVEKDFFRFVFCLLDIVFDNSLDLRFIIWN